jgi:hypothetical protein
MAGFVMFWQEMAGFVMTFRFFWTLTFFKRGTRKSERGAITFARQSSDTPRPAGVRADHKAALRHIDAVARGGAFNILFIRRGSNMGIGF